MRVLLHRVKFQNVVARERVEVQPLDRSCVEHDQRELLNAVGVVGVAQLDTQALEAEQGEGREEGKRRLKNRKLWGAAKKLVLTPSGPQKITHY